MVSVSLSGCRRVRINHREARLMADKTLIYVGAEASGLYRKEAGDDRWENLTRGMAPSAQVRAIAIHPDDPATIFAGTQRGVFRSIDRGDNWERMNMTEGRGVSYTHLTLPTNREV